MVESTNKDDLSLGEVHGSIDTSLPKKGWKRMLAYFGPAYLVSVGYMDPGNWATDLQGGAKFGYQLIWVLLMSNLMALLLQGLSARLGIVRRKDLAQANRDTYPPAINFCLYLLAEFAIAACDLAEVLGMALGINLLTGLPLLGGVGLTVLDTFLLLWLQRFGIRKLEAFIIALVACIGLSFLIEIVLAKPKISLVMGGFIPGPLNTEALYIAIGIIGATVMPHNLYLHSALVQTRKIKHDKEGIEQALKYNFIDSSIALNAAFFVNTAILVLAATVFFSSGHTEVARIEDAHRLLQPLLGNKLAPIIFSLALIAAGQSSTITGTMAGQIVMEGYISFRMNPMLRRLMTRLLAVIPAMVAIIWFGEKKVDDLLVLSQVFLSLQLGFAIIPLIHFVSDKKTMGDNAIKLPEKILSWLVAIILVGLNTKLVADMLMGFLASDGPVLLKILSILAAIALLVLFVAMSIIPLKKKDTLPYRQKLHAKAMPLGNILVPQLGKIAIALDFTESDDKLIAYALSQGGKTSNYFLLHVVESVSADYLGKESDDDETRLDRERLSNYAKQLIGLGYVVDFSLGYKHRKKEIVRLVKESGANMLVMGAHRHTGIKDYLFGETIEAVRHELDILVLIVSV